MAAGGNTGDQGAADRGTLAAFIGLAVLWGIPYLFIKVAVSELTPETVVLVRTALGAVILLPLAARSGGFGWLRQRREALALVAFAVGEIVIPWYCIAAAETRLTSSLTALLIAAVPLGAAIGGFFGGHRSSRFQVAGLLVGFAGVALLVGFDARGAGLVPLIEIALVVVGYSLAPMVLSRHLAHRPPAAVMGGALAIAALLYLPFGAAGIHGLPSPASLASLAILGVGCTAVAFLLFFRIVARWGPVRMTLVAYINPAVATAAGVAFLGEKFGITTAAGFALILGGSIAAGRARRASTPGPEGTERSSTDFRASDS